MHRHCVYNTQANEIQLKCNSIYIDSIEISQLKKHVFTVREIKHEMKLMTKKL